MSSTANKIRLMEKRRQLTAQQKIAQQRLREIWHAKKKRLDLTQEKAAHLIGWSSQGAVASYLNGRIGLNTDAIMKFAKLLEVKPSDIDPDFQWGEMVQSDPFGEGAGKFFDHHKQIDPDEVYGDNTPKAQEADIPRHVRDLVDAILKRARDGSLTKEHTAVLKSSLELMTGGK